MPRRTFKPHIEEAIVMYTNGDTVQKIGDHFGFHKAAIARCLRQAGVAMRPSNRLKEGNLERFEVKIQKTPGCWPWRGKINEITGYGSFLWHRTPDEPAREWGSHRCSYLLFNGPIPDGLLVRHTCDVRFCVNPAHLVLGTDMDNKQDQIDRGHVFKGEEVVQAKLTTVRVIELRELHAQGWTQSRLAEKFGVTQATVHRAAHRISWRHIP